jgi:glycosyltransferase 2 family protein
VAVGVTATFETLTSMGAGALIGVSLLPWIGVDFGFDNWHFLALLVLAGSPIGLGLLVLAASRITRKSSNAHARQLKSPPFWLLFLGLLFTSLGWFPLGLSLWATLQAVTPAEIPLTFERYLSLLGTVALSYVAGFVIVFSPGGLGTREFILQKVLTLQLAPLLGAPGAGLAVVVTLLLRLVWTLFEVIVSGLMWAFAPLAKPVEGSDD